MRPSSASKLLASDNTNRLTATEVPLLLVGRGIGRGIGRGGGGGGGEEGRPLGRPNSYSMRQTRTPVVPPCFFMHARYPLPHLKLHMQFLNNAHQMIVYCSLTKQQISVLCRGERLRE